MYFFSICKLQNVEIGLVFDPQAVKNQNYWSSALQESKKDGNPLSCESLTMLRRLPQTPRRLLRRGRGALNVLLMSVPPIFNIGLVSLLSYYTVHHNNDSVNWALFAAFIGHSKTTLTIYWSFLTMYLTTTCWHFGEICWLSWKNICVLMTFITL